MRDDLANRTTATWNDDSGSKDETEAYQLNIRKQNLIFVKKQIKVEIKTSYIDTLLIFSKF